MPVRLRITILFVILVMFLLALICGSIYYFSYTNRINTIKTRLTNRAKTTASLLAQREIFDQQLVRRIDSLTTIALKNKTVQAYDSNNRLIYFYSDVPGDSLMVDTSILQRSRTDGPVFFDYGQKEVIAYPWMENVSMVVISAAEDVEGKKGIQTLQSILVFSFLIGSALVMIAGYIFSKTIIQPIKKITSEAKTISAQNLTRRIKSGTSKDEWDRLVATLNELLDRLQESFELQRRFISNASHELSTPLTSVSSQIDVSLQRDRTASEYKQVLQSIHQDVHHMSKLVQTLLEFAKASGNPGGLEINLVRVDDVLFRLPAEMAKIDPEYSVNIQFAQLPEDEELLLVFGNEPLLFTAFRNIVMNACKYSDDHQALVKLSVEESRLNISIADKGKGIPADELKTIFQPFYRVEENISKQGFGLGLSLADRIVKLHKGLIKVESEINVGTEFIITLPGARALGRL